MHFRGYKVDNAWADWSFRFILFVRSSSPLGSDFELLDALFQARDFVLNVLDLFSSRPILHVVRGMRCDDAVNVCNGGYGATRGFLLVVLPVVFYCVYTSYGFFEGERDLLAFAFYFGKAIAVIVGLGVVITRHTSSNPIGGFIRPSLILGAILVTLPQSIRRGMVAFEGIYLPFTVSTVFIELAIFAGGKMVAQAIEAFGDANVTGPFLASLAELLMVLVIMSLAALRAPKDV